MSDHKEYLLAPNPPIMDIENGRQPDFAQAERVKAVHALELLDTPPEPAYDDIVKLAQYLTGAPICLITLVDDQRLWFKAKVGTSLTEVPLSLAVDPAWMRKGDFLEIEDFQQHEKYREIPLANSPLGLRYYAGVPLTTKYGVTVGTLSILDVVPRRLTEEQKIALRTLANQVSTLFNLRTSHQELRHLTDSQQRILAITGHDIKSPLTALQMVLQMRLSGEIKDAEVTEMLPMLLQQVKGSLRLINNLVQWGQLVVQRGTRYVTSFYLHQEVANCVEEMAYKANQKNNTLINKVCETELVRADPYATAFILRNLVSNAIKFTTDGTISISFERQGANAWLHITDTGIGMSSHMALQLQKQAAGQMRKGTDGEEGHGLGLALVADYVRSVNGQLLIDTQEGKGTRVSIEI